MICIFNVRKVVVEFCLLFATTITPTPSNKQLLP